jgi:hypothetical protein
MEPRLLGPPFFSLLLWNAELLASRGLGFPLFVSHLPAGGRFNSLNGPRIFAQPSSLQELLSPTGAVLRGSGLASGHLLLVKKGLEGAGRPKELAVLVYPPRRIREAREERHGDERASASGPPSHFLRWSGRRALCVFLVELGLDWARRANPAIPFWQRP